MINLRDVDLAILGVVPQLAERYPWGAAPSAKRIQGLQIGRLLDRLMTHVLLPLVHRMGATFHSFPDRDWNSLVLMLMADRYTKTSEQARSTIDILPSRAWKRADDRHYPCKEI